MQKPATWLSKNARINIKIMYLLVIILIAGIWWTICTAVTTNNQREREREREGEEGGGEHISNQHIAVITHLFKSNVKETKSKVDQTTL